MKNRKTITKAVAAILAGLLLVGCANENEPVSSSEESKVVSSETATKESEVVEVSNLNEEGYPVVKEPITITVTGKLSSNEDPWEGLAQVEYLSELTGVNLEMTGIHSEAWAQQKGLMLTSDDLADLIISADYTKEEYFKYGEEGLFIPLNDLIEKYMPNLKALLEEYPEIKAMMTNADGSIYALPRFAPVVRDMHRRYWLNEVWVENLGLKMPETLDDYYNILKAFKEQDANGNGDPNDEIPLSGFEGKDANTGLILNALGVNAKNDLYGYTYDEAGNVYCVNTSEGYKEYLKFMNKVYEEKILDQEYFTQTQDQWKAKQQENLVGATQSAAMYNTAGTEIGYNYTQIDGLTSALNDTPMVTSWFKCTLIGAITKNNENPEATARMLDYFYSEEGGILAYVGVQGVTWDWVDESAGTWDKLTKEGYETAEKYRYVECVVGGWPSYERMEFNMGQGSENALWLNAMSYKSSEHFVAEFPLSYFALSSDDAELVESYRTDLETYTTQMRADFITGKKDIDAEWDAYVKQMDKMGVAEILPIYQKAYEEYVALTK